MTARLFELTAAIVRRALKALPNIKGKRTRLPAVITLVVSTSPTPYPYNLDFHDYFSPHGREFTANATSILVDLVCLSEDDLQQPLQSSSEAGSLYLMPLSSGPVLVITYGIC